MHKNVVRESRVCVCYSENKNLKPQIIINVIIIFLSFKKKFSLVHIYWTSWKYFLLISTGKKKKLVSDIFYPCFFLRPWSVNCCNFCLFFYCSQSRGCCQGGKAGGAGQKTFPRFLLLFCQFYVILNRLSNKKCRICLWSCLCL